MKRVRQIHLDTPLRPRAIAEAVWEEASLWLRQPLPRRWLRELITEANTVYAHNARSGGSCARRVSRAASGFGCLRGTGWRR
jgi:hypothetical protein